MLDRDLPHEHDVIRGLTQMRNYFSTLYPVVRWYQCSIHKFALCIYKLSFSRTRRAKRFNECAQTDKLTRFAFNDCLLRSEISFNLRRSDFPSNVTSAASACGEGGPNRCHSTKCLFTYSTIPLGQHIPQLLVFTRRPQWQSKHKATTKNVCLGRKHSRGHCGWLVVKLTSEKL